jgi:carboxymethylenebutenolidase
MIERHLDIPTQNGAMNSFIVYPEEDGNNVKSSGQFPVVLFYMDAPGKREELHDMARRIAAVGYYVVLPNLYYRTSRDYVLKERTEPAMAEMYGHMDSITNGKIADDTGAILRFLEAQPEADALRVSAVGYCMSGPFVFAAAAAYPEHIQSIAAIHPARMVTDQPDSPHLMGSKIKCETYIGCAEIDKWAPPADIKLLGDNLTAAGTPHRIEWYGQCEHGFVFPKRPIYNQAAAERHWERLFALWKRTL